VATENYDVDQSHRASVADLVDVQPSTRRGLGAEWTHAGMVDQASEKGR
jgi:hypothetical protein